MVEYPLRCGWVYGGSLLSRQYQKDSRQVSIVPEKKKAKAVKVDHTKAVIPPPTEQLLIELAVGIHLSVAGAAACDRNETLDEYPEWDSLTQETKHYWIQGARCAYSIIAVHGGGEVIRLAE